MSEDESRTVRAALDKVLIFQVASFLVVLSTKKL